MLTHPYIVETHMFKYENKPFIFEVIGQNLYDVDEDTYNIAQLCDGSSSDTIVQIARDKYGLDNEYTKNILSDLEKNKLIMDQKAHIFHRTEKIEFPDKMPIYALALHVAHDCNLRCLYCYGSGGSFGGPRDYMDEKTALRSIDFLLENAPVELQYSIIFFGGEPLMNYDLIKKVTEYCRKKEKETGKVFNLGMTTNGTLLNDEMMEYFDKNGITIGISIDGPKEIHDQCRKCADGSGSFDSMFKNVEKLLERRDGKVTARITLTRKDLEMHKITHEVENMGFKKVNVALVEADENTPFAIHKEDLEVINQEYKIIAEEMYNAIIERRKFYTNIFYSHLSMLHNKNIMFYNCGAGRRYMAVAPDGSLYLCHRFAGMENYKMGDVFNGILPGTQKNVINAHVDAREECQECWARYICGGGCFYNSVEKGGSLYKSPNFYCESYKCLFETSMYLYWKLNSYDPTIVERLLAPAGENYYDEEATNC